MKQITSQRSVLALLIVKIWTSPDSPEQYQLPAEINRWMKAHLGWFMGSIHRPEVKQKLEEIGLSKIWDIVAKQPDSTIDQLDAYLSRCVANAMKNELRKIRQRREVYEYDFFSLPAMNRGEPNDPMEHVISSEMLQRLKICVRKLRPKDREVWRELAIGYPRKDIAKRLHMGIVSVHYSIKRIREACLSDRIT